MGEDKADSHRGPIIVITLGRGAYLSHTGIEHQPLRPAEGGDDHICVPAVQDVDVNPHHAESAN